MRVSEKAGFLNSKNEDKLKNTNLGIELDRKARPRASSSSSAGT